MINIRRIEKKDDVQVEALIRSCLIEYGANHEGTAWCDPTLACFSSLYVGEGNAYWVAVDEKDRVVAGVGIMKLEGKANICELQKMYSYKEIRGSGVASELMNIALAYANEYYDACYIETLENMIEARHFYEKYGFKRIDEAIIDTGHYACDIRYILYFEKE
ncbi:MAG: GNAT family N-acetyltransferase [Solobacterium sp.]|nr:GNAT family N-acetyltransferase [Solobacterium sp.]